MRMTNYGRLTSSWRSLHTAVCRDMQEYHIVRVWRLAETQQGIDNHLSILLLLWHGVWSH